MISKALLVHRRLGWLHCNSHPKNVRCWVVKGTIHGPFRIADWGKPDKYLPTQRLFASKWEGQDSGRWHCFRFGCCCRCSEMILRLYGTFWPIFLEAFIWNVFYTSTCRLHIKSKCDPICNSIDVIITFLERNSSYICAVILWTLYNQQPYNIFEYLHKISRCFLDFSWLTLWVNIS